MSIVRKFGPVIYRDKDGGAGNGSEGDHGGGEPAGETVSKAEYDRILQENRQAKQELEDARSEVFSEEYLEWLKAKEDGAGKKEEKPKEETPKGSPTDPSKMTPQQLQEYIDASVAKGIKAHSADQEKRIASERKAETEKMISQFRKTHEDFDEYRPIMYGLSLDTDFKDASLQELYDAAKERVRKLGGVKPSKEHQERSRRSSGEKPGGSSSSIRRSGKSQSDEEAADEAWEESVGEAGLPTE